MVIAPETTFLSRYVVLPADAARGRDRPHGPRRAAWHQDELAWPKLAVGPRLAADRGLDSKGMLIRDANAERTPPPARRSTRRTCSDTLISLEETRARPAESSRDRIENTTKTHPWLVARGRETTLIGYAYATRHRERACYRWATDVTVYVTPERHDAEASAARSTRPCSDSSASRASGSPAPASLCPTRRASGCTSRSDSSRWASTEGSAGSSGPGTTSAGGSSISGGTGAPSEPGAPQRRRH